MRYSYEFKKEAVQFYRQGKWPETPKGTSTSSFRQAVRDWTKLEDLHGPEVLKHKRNRNWLPDEKLALISKVNAGQSLKKVSLQAGINSGLLYSWMRKYELYGYNGLENKKRGRTPKEKSMKKKKLTPPKPLNESEREELIRLRSEVEAIKAENAVIKKEIALREKRYAAQLKARKQRLSKNSEKKDIP